MIEKKGLLKKILFYCPIILISFFVLISCDQCNRPSVQINETFLLTFMDNEEKIRVRFSENGSTWSLAEINNALTDAGVGATAESSGAIRLVAFTDLPGRLNLRFGLGAVFDDSGLIFDNGPDGNRLRLGSAPAVAYAGNNKWILTFAKYNKAEILIYDHSNRQLINMVPGNDLVSQGQMLVYDPHLHITWHKNAGMGESIPDDPDYFAALEWIENYTYHDPVLDMTLTDWRCASIREYQHLFDVHGIRIDNQEPFINIHGSRGLGFYWSSDGTVPCESDYPSSVQCVPTYNFIYYPPAPNPPQEGVTHVGLSHIKNEHVWPVKDGNVWTSKIETANTDLHNGPAIITGNGRIVMSWLRHTSPVKLRIITGELGRDPVVFWKNAYNFDISEEGYGNVLYDPTLAWDHTNFYLGVVRKKNGVSENALFIYSSPDGNSWTYYDKITNIPVSSYGMFVELACKSNGTKVAAVVGESVKIYRKSQYDWVELPDDVVFGSRRPEIRKFSLISAGQTSE